MSTFGFVKLVNETQGGKSEIKVHVSQIHKFNENSHHPFQQYKIDLENGTVGLGTIIFMSSK